MFELLENGNPLHPLICVAGASEICSCDCDETDFYTVLVEPGDSAPASMGRQYYDYSDGVAYFIPPGTSFRAFSCCAGAGCDWQGRALFFHRILLEGTCLEDIQDRYTFFRYRSRNEALHLSSRNMGLLQRCLDGIDWELSSCIDEYTSTLIVNRLEMMLNYCLRFYRYQFIIRHEADMQIIGKMDGIVQKHFLRSSGTCRKELPSLQATSRLLNISPAYLEDMLHHETGMTWIEYIRKKQFDTAGQELMRTDKSITQIARELGYPSVGYFNRIFQKLHGCTPAEYRSHC